MNEQTVSEQYPYAQEFLEDPVQEQEALLDEEDMAEQQDRMEEQHNDIEDADWANIPQQRRNDSLYHLFHKVWKSPDSSKVANLDKTELGVNPIMSVRNAQFLALLGLTTSHRGFSRFFNTLGEITLKTSASKKGWFTELFVSQKKSTSRFTGVPNQNQFKPKKKFSLFGAGSGENVQGNSGGGEE